MVSKFQPPESFSCFLQCVKTHPVFSRQNFSYRNMGRYPPSSKILLGDPQKDGSFHNNSKFFVSVLPKLRSISIPGEVYVFLCLTSFFEGSFISKKIQIYVKKTKTSKSQTNLSPISLFLFFVDLCRSVFRSPHFRLQEVRELERIVEETTEDNIRLRTDMRS